MPDKKINISFADLVHRGHSCNAIPYGASMVAAYAIKEYGDKIKVDIFKDTADFTDYLSKTTPQIASFSNYIWNTNLSCEYARRIKEHAPDTIIIFGGSNYPVEPELQKEFLTTHPYIDFYIFKEGEPAFVELLDSLLKCDLDASKIKKDRLNISNCHYISEGELITGDLKDPIVELDEIPSPYLSGICDKFLEKELIPLIQTTRGCPFTCTYCQESDEYYSKVRRFSLERIRDEVEYISKHTDVPNLMLADANFGMYVEDLEICREIARIQEKSGWPKYFIGIDGKNQKKRVLEAASIVKGSHLTAAVQSTDADVLKKIKRQNVSLEEMVQVAKDGKASNANSFSEVILCLPGDRKEAHFKTNFDLMDADINVVRSHQFIMLSGSEAATKKSRKEFKMGTRFRVAPSTVKPYELYGETFCAPEIDEICVENSTMSFEDYLACRQLNLTVEIFYNDSVFDELIKLLRRYDIAISSFILNIHESILADPGPLSGLYDDFLRETKELWTKREDVEEFLKQPGTIDRYLAGELGNNEQLMYRAFAVFRYMDQLHKIAFNVAREMLGDVSAYDDRHCEYLEELLDYSLLRKEDILSVEATKDRVFHYDFIGLAASRFDDEPLSKFVPEGVKMTFKHTDEQKKLISEYLRIFGSSDYGLGSILSQAHDVSNFYRDVKVI